MMVALSGRIHLDEATDVTAEDVLREIWNERFLVRGDAARTAGREPGRRRDPGDRRAAERKEKPPKDSLLPRQSCKQGPQPDDRHDAPDLNGSRNKEELPQRGQLD